MDYSSYFHNQNENEFNNGVLEEPSAASNEDAVITSEEAVQEDMILSFGDMLSMLSRVCGVDEIGENKGIANYQVYAETDDEQKKSLIYSAKKARISVSAEPALPGFFVIDMAFRSADDAELKMLWGLAHQNSSENLLLK